MGLVTAPVRLLLHYKWQQAHREQTRINIICEAPPVMLKELQMVRVNEIEELNRICYMSVADGHIRHQSCQ